MASWLCWEMIVAVEKRVLCFLFSLSPARGRTRPFSLPHPPARAQNEPNTNLDIPALTPSNAPVVYDKPAQNERDECQ